MTHKDVQDWFANPVTKEFFNTVLERANNMKELIAYSAGANQEEDCVRRGYFMAYLDILDTKIEETEND